MTTRDAPTYYVKVGPIAASPKPVSANDAASNAAAAAAPGIHAVSNSTGTVSSTSTPDPTAVAGTTSGGQATPSPAATVSAGSIAYTFSADPIDVSERTLLVEHDEEDKKADKLELSLDNFDLSLFDDPNWKHGNGIEASWGYAGNMTLPRFFIIQKITGGFPVLKVTALATSIIMNKLKKSTTYQAMKRSDIVAQIATANGFASSAQFIDDSEEIVDTTHQACMTDAEFLQHLAQREGFVFYIGADGLHWEQRKMGTAPVRLFTYYTDPQAGDILSLSLENDVTALPGIITSAGRTLDPKGDIQQDASNTQTQRGVVAPTTIAVAARTGAVTTNVTPDPSTPTAGSAIILSNAPTSAVAKREADGKYTKAQQVAAHLSMSIVGDPSVNAKQVIEIAGISARLSGRYYVKKCKTKVSATEYTQGLEVIADGLNAGAGVAGVKSDGTLNQQNPADPGGLHAVSNSTGEISYVQNTGQSPGSSGP